jgi:tetratricopeptide (TPR) repeat protein
MFHLDVPFLLFSEEPVVQDTCTSFSQPIAIKLIATALVVCGLTTPLMAQSPLQEPVVARVEMKLAIDEQVVDTIAQGDLLTVLEEREDDYVILTHDGSKGAIDKVNAVRIAESGDIYSELILKNPDEGRYYTLRAAAWWALGKADRALEDFDKAIELGYTESHAYTSRGLFHAEIGNFDQAIADYDQALRINPKDISPIINRAAVHMSQGEAMKAVQDYTLALKVKSDSTSLLHQRAIALKVAGKLDEAAADFDKILQQHPRDYAAIMGRGYVYFQKQDYGKAIEDFAKAIELDPDDAVAFNNRGYNQHQLGEYAGALEDYDEALRLAPKYGLVLQNRAWLLATASDKNFRDPAAAVDSAKQACELSNYSAIGDLSALAAALAADEKFDEAVGWQEKVVELVADQYKEFAQKTLERYENERPFASDPDKANAADQAAAEAEGTEQQQANQPAEDEPKA